MASSTCCCFCCSADAPRVRLVLVLVLIQLEVEEVGEIASRAAATTASAATLADLNLNLAEGGFGAQQMLQGLLLGRHRVLEREAFELVRRGRHRRDREFHFLDEALERRAAAVELPRFGAVGERLRLIAKLRLHFREILAILRRPRLSPSRRRSPD